jgi:hypothetical protein
MTCPKCAGQMSTPIRSTRTNCWNSTCRSCGHFTHSTTPLEEPARNPEADHSRMFERQATETIRPSREGAMARFDREHTAGTVRKAIKARQVEHDPRARQVGER